MVPAAFDTGRHPSRQQEYHSPKSNLVLCIIMQWQVLFFNDRLERYLLNKTGGGIVIPEVSVSVVL